MWELVLKIDCSPISENQVSWELDYIVYLKSYKPSQLFPTLNFKKIKNQPGSHIEIWRIEINGFQKSENHPTMFLKLIFSKKSLIIFLSFWCCSFTFDAQRRSKHICSPPVCASNDTKINQFNYGMKEYKKLSLISTCWVIGGFILSWC